MKPNYPAACIENESCCCVDLDVQGNVLTSLPDAVGDMEHLISINLSKNRLTVFPERLTHVKSLENISVEGNQITGDMSRNHNSILHTLNIPSAFTRPRAVKHQRC